MQEAGIKVSYSSLKCESPVHKLRFYFLGDSCNIGIVARHPAYLPYIKQALTSQNVATYFSHCFDNPSEANVEVFDLPGFNAINLLLHNSLGGGGMASLRPGPLGKAFGQMLLSYELKDIPPLDDIVANYDKSND